MKSVPRFHSVLAAAASLAAASAPLAAQEFTAADSGWVRIFNGTDFSGLYSRTYGSAAPLVTPPATPYSIEYAGTDTAAIRVGATSPQGNIGTIDTTFSHYRMRVEAKFDAFGTTNAGLVYHTRESAIRMQNNWPRSIEFQFKQDQTGSGYSIQQVAFTTRVSSTGQGSNYNPGGTVVNVCEIGCNGRWYKGNPHISTRLGTTGTATRWLRYHLVVRGADSATHIVNDTVVFALWNIRIFNDSTKPTGSNSSNQPSASNFTPSGPHGSGGLALQAEGTTLRYRRWEVMRFPASTPKNAPYLHRLFLDAPAGPVKPDASAPVTIQWRSIGTLPKVKIEYRVGSGAWQTAADSVPDTGSYTWNAPGSVPDSLRFRVSSLDYVWPDSTREGGAVSVRPARPSAAGQMFATRGGTLVVSGMAGYDRMAVRDAAGRRVRSLALQGAEARWDLRDETGSKVRPGLYFFRLTGSGAPYDGRVLVD